VAYVAIASDLNGSIFSIDHDGQLHHNRRDLGGSGLFEEPGLGRVIGASWGGIRQLGASRTADRLVLVGVTLTGEFVSAETALSSLAQWNNVVPTRHPDNRWAGIRNVSGGPNGTFIGIQPDRHLSRLFFEAQQLPRVRPGTSALPQRGQSEALVPGQIDDLGEGFGDSLLVFTNGRMVFDVTDDGTLRHVEGLNLSPGPSAATGMPRRWVQLATGWTRFQRVFAADESSIYTISSEGDLAVRRFVVDGQKVYLLMHDPDLVIGTGIFGWGTLPSRIEGYCTPQSAKPGDTVSFKVATRRTSNSEQPEASAAYSVDYVRLRRLEDGGERDRDCVMNPPDREDRRAVARRLPDDWLQRGVNWPESFALTVPEGWGSGLYAARCTDQSGERFYVPFVVRGTTEERPFAVLANTNTWNAYNVWGGQCKYVAPLPKVIPFERPHPALAPGPLPKNPDGSEVVGHSLHLLRAELWVLGWLESLGEKYAYDLFTDLDLHKGIDRLATGAPRPYKAVILNTHPEYWTRAMYCALEAYRSRGGSVLYLGGNGLYEQVEFEGDSLLRVFPGVDWTKVGQGDSNEVVRKSCLSRERGQPERALLGVGFERGGNQPFQLALPPNASPALSGVTLNQRDEFGQSSVYAKQVPANGWETDRRGDHSPKPAWEKTALLAAGKDCYRSGEMLYYETGYGGVVFAASSLRFGGSLPVDETIQKIVTNVLNICLSR
jgi:hypothetical protein